jgi:threonyl-tRNA synthetase
MQKIPYMLIVGDKEVSDRTVAVRSREDGDQGAVAPKELIERLLGEIKEKKR